MVGAHAFFLWSVRERIAKGDPDFTSFYSAGVLLREGHGDQLYNGYAQQQVQQQFANDSDIRRGPLPYIHPAYEALLFAPLTLLTYQAAFLVWEGLNLALLVAIAVLLRRSLPSLQPVPGWEWVLGLLAFFPVFANFLQGQDAVLLLFVFVLCFRALESNSELIAGLWLGLGVFRFHLLIPLVVILALWRRRKMVAGFAVTSSAAAVASLAIVGWHGAMQYPAYVWHWASTAGVGNMPASLMPNLLGLVTGWPLPQNARWPLQLGVIAGSLALLIMVARLRSAGNESGISHLSFACAVIAALLTSYNTGSYDLCLLVLPFALIADYALQIFPQLPEVGRKILLPSLPLLVSPLWFLLWRRWERINLMAIFLLWWMYAIRREIVRITGNFEGTSRRLS